MQSRPPHCRSPNINTCAAAAAPPLCAVCVNLTWCGFDSIPDTWLVRVVCQNTDVSRCRACERSPLVHVYDSWTCPARYLETSSGEVTYYNQLNPEDTRTFKLFSVMNSVKWCLDIFWSLTFTFEERVEQQEAGHDVWILLCKDQCCCSQLLHTASALITKSSGISSCFQVDVFVFYVFGSSSSSWDLCVLPVSRPSRVCVVNTSTRSLWILWTFTCSILTWTHSETLLGGWKEKFQKMSRTTWLRLQVWKQRQWCWVKVLYFHTWTQINLQFSLILYTLY